MSSCMPVSPPKESIGLNDPKHQGKFHLLAILVIPLTLVSVFLLNNIWITLAVVFSTALAIALLFFRKK